MCVGVGVGGYVFINIYLYVLGCCNDWWHTYCPGGLIGLWRFDWLIVAHIFPLPGGGGGGGMSGEFAGIWE